MRVSMKSANRREKVFQNYETRVPLDREAKVRIMHLARCLKHRTEEGKHYGVLTGKFVDVLQAMVWLIHDGKTGQCNPALATIADKADCCPNTVCAAIKALEACGILSWVNRLVKVRVSFRDLFGRIRHEWRVLRTSNAYIFCDPKAVGPSKRKLCEGPLDTSFKKETESGARLVGAPIHVKEGPSAPPDLPLPQPQTTAPPLALRGEHGLGGGVPLSPAERAAIVARMDRGAASKEDYLRYGHDLDARINARSAK